MRLIASVFLALFLAAPAAGAESDFPDGYTAHHTFTELRAELRKLADEHPSIVRLSSIGRSHQGRKLFMVKISDNAGTDEPEREVYVDGGIHGHEHASTEQALALIRCLVEGYGSDARSTAIVDSTEIWVAPLVNPDGASFDISGGQFHQWRKNRQPNPGGSIGTDINRNFGYHWAGPGSSAVPQNAFYRGARRWSAPEARRIRDFVRKRIVGGKQQLALALTLHSHGEFVMHPFGWTSQSLPPDMRQADLDKFRLLTGGIAARNGYRALQAGTLYRSSGTFMDWAYAGHRILAITVEMAPPASVDNGWYLRDEALRLELQRNRDALMWLLEQVQTIA